MWNLNDNNINYHTFYQAIMWRLGDDKDPWVQDTLTWWNEYVVFQIHGEQLDSHYRCMFRNECGKVFIEDANNQADNECNQFEHRWAERKAAK